MSAKNDMIMAALESAKIKFDRLTMGDKEMILNIVDFVCKAQRNACTRIYNKHYGNSEHYDECCGLEIFTAEIERCNYE